MINVDEDQRSDLLDIQFNGTGMVELPTNSASDSTVVGQRSGISQDVVVCESVGDVVVRVSLYDPFGKAKNFEDGQSSVLVDLMPPDITPSYIRYRPTQILADQRGRIFVIGTLLILNIGFDAFNPVVFRLDYSGNLDRTFGTDGIVYFDIGPDTNRQAYATHKISVNPKPVKSALPGKALLAAPAVFQAAFMHTSLLLTFANRAYTARFEDGLVICLDERGQFNQDFGDVLNQLPLVGQKANRSGYKFIRHDSKDTYFYAVAFNANSSKIFVAGCDSEFGGVEGDAIICGLSAQGDLLAEYGQAGWKPVATGNLGAQVQWLGVDEQNRTYGCGTVARAAPNGQDAFLVALDDYGDLIPTFNRGVLLRFKLINQGVEHQVFGSWLVTTPTSVTVLMKPLFNAPHIGLARFSHDGVADAGYGYGGQLIFPPDADITSLQMQHDNKLLLLTGTPRAENKKLYIYRYRPAIRAAEGNVVTQPLDSVRSDQLDTLFGTTGSVELPQEASSALVGQRKDAGGTIIVCNKIDSNRVRLVLYDKFGTRINFSNEQAQIDVDLTPLAEPGISEFTPTQIVTGNSQKIYIVGTMYITKWVEDSSNPVVFCLDEFGSLDTTFGPNQDGIVHFEISLIAPPENWKKTWIDSSNAKKLARIEVSDPFPVRPSPPRHVPIEHYQKRLESTTRLQLPPAFQAVTRDNDLLLTYSTRYTANYYDAGLVICLNSAGILRSTFGEGGYTFLSHDGRPTYFSAVTYNTSTSSIIVGGGDLDPGDIKGKAIVCALDANGHVLPTFGNNGWAVVDEALYGAQLDWLTYDNINRTFGCGTTWDDAGGQQALLVALDSNGQPLTDFNGGKVRFRLSRFNQSYEVYGTCVVSGTMETTVLVKPSTSTQVQGLARFGTDGKPVSNYGNNGQLSFPEGTDINNIQLQVDGKLLLIRRETENGVTQLKLYRYAL